MFPKELRERAGSRQYLPMWDRCARSSQVFRKAWSPHPPSNCFYHINQSNSALAIKQEVIIPHSKEKKSWTNWKISTLLELSENWSYRSNSCPKHWKHRWIKNQGLSGTEAHDQTLTVCKYRNTESVIYELLEVLCGRDWDKNNKQLKFMWAIEMSLSRQMNEKWWYIHIKEYCQ